MAPPNLQAIIERVRAAHADRTPLRIQGGGSKDFFTGRVSDLLSANPEGQAPQAAGELLDTRGLTGVRSYEPTELVVTVAAGTPVAELEALLAGHGQCLPFEPPHYSWSGPGAATVGGMVAAGLSGPARANVGGLRDYVLGLQMVNGLGQHLTFGGQVMKNVAGYDVSRLMAGSLGTLGLITEVSLKVLPRAVAEATLSFEMDQQLALEHLHRWGGQPLPLNASCWVRDDTESPARDLLFVRLRGAVAAVEAACTSMMQTVVGHRLNTENAARDWELCRNQQLPFFAAPADTGNVLWRLSLPQTAPVLDVPWAELVEWHGAQRWLWAPLSEAQAVQTAARDAGGTAVVFYAPEAAVSEEEQEGLASLRWRLDGGSAAQNALASRLKASFDPHGIFNPALSPGQGLPSIHR